MKIIKNEKGYALLMVLMVILLFTVLGMALMATNMNSAKQFTIKESQVQARHQAEMGILHYQAILEDKFNASSLTSLSCSDLEALLGVEKKLVGGSYKVESANLHANDPANPTGASCKEVTSDQLEIKVKSRGIIGGNMEKEVEATFYVNNTKPTAPPLPPTLPTDENEIIRDLGEECRETGNGKEKQCGYSIDKTDKFADLEEYNTSKGDFHFKDHLLVGKLTIGGGNSATIQVNKDLYIEETADIQNHACIGVGGNFTMGNSVELGSQADILVRKDVYFPSTIERWNTTTKMYIFGDLYIPEQFSNYGDYKVYIGGEVFLQNSEGKFTKTENPFQSMTERQINEANNLSCVVEEAPDLPNWVLDADKNVDYH